MIPVFQNYEYFHRNRITLSGPPVSSPTTNSPRICIAERLLKILFYGCKNRTVVENQTAK